jgi:P27 family predicted phage terminase small subunit
MGRRGPKTMPLEQPTLCATSRSKLNRSPRRPTPGRPDWYDGDAKTAWKFVTKALDDMGLLYTCDRNALTRYCQYWARWKTGEEFLQKHGKRLPAKDNQGNVISFTPMPECRRSLELARELSLLAGEFGLTPSARSRLEVYLTGGEPDAFEAGEMQIIG